MNDLEQALLARGGRVRGDEITFPCPFADRHKHGDRDPSASYNVAKKVWLCRADGARGGYVALSKALGIAEPTRTTTNERVWTIRTARDETVEHHRVDRDGGKKNGGTTRRWWTRNGAKGLDGLRTADLPLYGVDDLAEAPKGTLVIVTEGEPARDALKAHGLVAVATVCGAAVTPADVSLEPLRGREVVLWADHDDEGRAHMTRIAERLRAMGIGARIFEWSKASRPGDDAADYFARGGTAAELSGLLAGTSLAPSNPDEGGQLLEDVGRFVRRFVVLTHHQADAAALWTLHTHAIDAAETTPYLHVTSPEKRSGKTRLLEVLRELVARPWLTGRVSPAVLARKIDDVRPTLLLDESDAAFRSGDEYAEALRGVLNTGYLRSGRTSVVVGQGAKMTYKDFDTFGAKAIAGIGSLPDTVQDRSIRIELKRRSVGEPVERFRRRKVAPEAKALRERIERWATASVPQLTDAEPALPDELDDRAADVWEPLFAIADGAGPAWASRARSAALPLSGSEVREDSSHGVRLLVDCRRVLAADVEHVATADLIAALVIDEEAPWSEWHKGRPITAHGLAKMLRPYGIRPRNVRASGAVVKGYVREQFTDAWARYLPPSPALSGSQSATSLQGNDDGPKGVADGPFADSPVADAKRPENAIATGLVAGIADARPEHERATADEWPPEVASWPEEHRRWLEQTVAYAESCGMDRAEARRDALADIRRQLEELNADPMVRAAVDTGFAAAEAVPPT